MTSFSVQDDIIRDPNKPVDIEELTEDEYIFLSTSHTVPGTDQNPEREIQFIGSNLEWELGETVEFSCVAAPFIYSNGIKWAVETKNGKLIYQRDSKNKQAFFSDDKQISFFLTDFREIHLQIFLTCSSNILDRHKWLQLSVY